MKFILPFINAIIIMSPVFTSVKPERKQDTVLFTGNRFMTFNIVIRVNQIEVAKEISGAGLLLTIRMEMARFVIGIFHQKSIFINLHRMKTILLIV